MRDKILIVTHYSKKYGYGHYSRSKNLFEALKKNYKFELRLFKTKNLKKKLSNINFNSSNKENLDLYKIIIFDLPKVLFKYINLIKLNNKVLIVDQLFNSKKYFYLLQNLKLRYSKKNIKYGFEYILLNNKINNINQSKIKKKNKIIVFGGSTSKIPKKIIKFCIEERKNYKFNFFNYKKFKNSYKFLNEIKSSRAIIMRFGVTTYESISMGLKPIVWTFSESKDRLSDIKFLQKKGLINLFDEKKFKQQIKKKNKIKMIRYNKINLFIKNILNSHNKTNHQIK